MKYRTHQEGFTLVELIIVVAIVGILAALSVTSYNHIRNQARAEQSKVNAKSVQKVAEAYYARNNQYPTTVAHFGSTQTTMPSDIQLLTSGTLSRANGEKSIMYRHVLSATGACIYYWDFAPEDDSTPGIRLHGLLGAATTSNCTATTGALPT